MAAFHRYAPSFYRGDVHLLHTPSAASGLGGCSVRPPEALPGAYSRRKKEGVLSWGIARR